MMRKNGIRMHSMRVAVLVGSLTGSGALMPATSSSSSTEASAQRIALAGSVAGIKKVWDELSDKQRVAAIQAFSAMPYQDAHFSLRAMPIILEYLAPREFTISMHDIAAQSKDPAMTKWFGNCSHPFLSIRPYTCFVDEKVLIEVSWCPDSSHATRCKRFRLRVNQDGTLKNSIPLHPGAFNVDPGTYIRPLTPSVSVCGFPIQGKHMINAQGESTIMSEAMVGERQWDTGNAVDVCISDFDSRAKSGTTIEGRFYNRQDNVLMSALACVYGYDCLLRDQQSEKSKVTAPQEESKGAARAR